MISMLMTFGALVTGVFGTSHPPTHPPIDSRRRDVPPTHPPHPSRLLFLHPPTHPPTHPPAGMNLNNGWNDGEPKHSHPIFLHVTTLLGTIIIGMGTFFILWMQKTGMLVS